MWSRAGSIFGVLTRRGFEELGVRADWVIGGLFGVTVAIALLLVVVPEIDLIVSGWFRHDEAGFIWREALFANLAHEGIQIGARILAVVVLLGFIYCAWKRTRLLGWDRQQWLFLLGALVVGPALVANVMLKDNWGRARPVSIEQFGGSRNFSPALMFSNECHTNCSFVAGDAAIGYYLHTIAYVVAPRRRRLVLGAGIVAGLLGGLLRIGMGAHFLSDVLFAGLFMLAASAFTHMLVYGHNATAAWWRALLAGNGAAPPVPPAGALP